MKRAANPSFFMLNSLQYNQEVCYMSTYEEIISLDREIKDELGRMECIDRKKTESEGYVKIGGLVVVFALCIVLGLSIPDLAMSYFGIDRAYREARTEVIITPTGECYHARGCPSNHGENIYVMLSEAKALGYRSCLSCSPGLYVPIVFRFIDIPFYTFIPALISYLLILKPIWKREKRRANLINEYKEASKHRMKECIGGKDIKEICGIPSDVFFDKDGLPYSTKENYVRYKARHGSVYHDRRDCVKAYLAETHVFKLMNVPMCRKCGTPLPEVSEWCERYNRYVTILNYYELNQNPTYKLADSFIPEMFRKSSRQ